MGPIKICHYVSTLSLLNLYTYSWKFSYHDRHGVSYTTTLVCLNLKYVYNRLDIG